MAAIISVLELREQILRYTPVLEGSLGIVAGSLSIILSYLIYQFVKVGGCGSPCSNWVNDVMPFLPRPNMDCVAVCVAAPHPFYFALFWIGAALIALGGGIFGLMAIRTRAYREK